MPKLTCHCGEQISLSAIPCPFEFDLIWDPLIEDVATALRDLYSRAPSADEFENGVYQLLRPPKNYRPVIVECSLCGRLAVFARPSDRSVAMWYEPMTVEEKARPTLRRLCDPANRPQRG